jgi:hypothetical protein
MVAGSDAASLYQPSVMNGNMVCSKFTANGYELAGMPAKGSQSVSRESNDQTAFVSTKLSNDGATGLLQQVPDTRHAVKRYSKGFGLFNFHSWRPFYNPPDISFTLYGENVLNTFSSELFYGYNTNERYHETGYRVAYGGWFPVVTAGITQRFNRNGRIGGNTVYWNELSGVAGLSLPLNLTKGRSIRSLTIGGNFVVDQVSYNGISKDVFNNRSINSVQPYIRFNNRIQQAVQHIYPRFAQNIAVSYRKALTRFDATQLLGTAAFYFPGLHVNHNLIVTAAYQQRDTFSSYRFSNNFPFSRGYDAVDAPRVWKFGANYSLPVAYPDAGLWNMVYFLRVRANAFYDYTVAKSLRTGRRFFYKSAGAEIFFDTKWWNALPVSFGVRYSHLFDDPLTNGLFEIVLPVDLF